MPGWHPRRHPDGGGGMSGLALTNFCSLRFLAIVTYAELHCHSNFSFLDGASHPVELATRAREVGLPALAITDAGGIYGAVRFVDACKKAGVHPVIGASLEVDGRDLVLLARTRAGYSNLTNLLSEAHRDQPKGEARATLRQLDRYRPDLACLTAPTARAAAWPCERASAGPSGRCRRGAPGARTATPRRPAGGRSPAGSPAGGTGRS